MSLQPLPANWQAPRLQGRHVSLEALAIEHAAGLRLALQGDALSALWYTNVPKAADAQAWVATALQKHAQGMEVPFVVRDAEGVAVGSTRFYDLDPAVPKLSIGYTWYAPRVQRTGLNTEAKLLLLTHAFESLGCVSVYLETSWFNHASRAAIARLGAKQDGVLRNHRRHADGSLRDTVVFSILGSEWSGVKSNLLHKLEQGDRHGQ
ncbi:GNAT family N-acetyltransferase [Pseudoxanthomonas sacheonensis]|uniref:GNAT family N-acetyltransferase n=1 Tax=Pseudoxanthomonas sacheonensis TaxID=443615 RepID=UPI0013D566A3|nr:GNAT family protein [Pseudoxanthomonas sacheonensis]KAF1707993.1 GNAT family N-acetyltransferase [Pseudoxanthomonas sacheonensis]